MKTIIVVYLARVGILGANEPNFDRIDYSEPKKYLSWPESLGDEGAIRSQAADIKAASDLETIRNILHWMGGNLKLDSEKAYEWRNYDDVVRERAYGGCADESIVCGVLLKAANIPTVWVKTLSTLILGLMPVSTVML